MPVKRLTKVAVTRSGWNPLAHIPCVPQTSRDAVRLESVGTDNDTDGPMVAVTRRRAETLREERAIPHHHGREQRIVRDLPGAGHLVRRRHRGDRRHTLRVGEAVADRPAIAAVAHNDLVAVPRAHEQTARPPEHSARHHTRGVERNSRRDTRPACLLSGTVWGAASGQNCQVRFDGVLTFNSGRRPKGCRGARCTSPGRWRYRTPRSRLCAMPDILEFTPFEMPWAITTSYKIRDGEDGPFPYGGPKARPDCDTTGGRQIILRQR